MYFKSQLFLSQYDKLFKNNNNTKKNLIDTKVFHILS